jgi:8-oxo-dGTP diphosphatase
MAAIGAESAFGADRARLETPRLVLTLVGRGDEADIQRWAADERVARFTARIRHPYPPDGARTFLDELLPAQAAGRDYVFVARRRDDGGFVGMIGVHRDESGRAAEFGYWLAVPQWGQGYATEAGRAVVGFAVGTLGLDRLEADVQLENAASMRVLAKLGFRESGTRRKESEARGRAYDVREFVLERMVAGCDPLAPPEGADKPLLLVVAAALVDADGRVMIARRPPGKPMAGLWEFPGGKVRPGEAPETALIRELKEELGIDVSSSCLAAFAFASHRYETFHLLMPLFVCRTWAGTPTPREGQELAWVTPVRLADYAMPPADVPLVALLRDLL